MDLKGPKDPPPHIYFLPGDTSVTDEEKPNYVALALEATKRQKKLGRVEKVLIRGPVHDTTINQFGKVVPDKPHVVMAFKSKGHIHKGSHVVSHAYVKGMDDLTLNEVTNTWEVMDDCPKFNGKPSWPDEILQEWQIQGSQPATKRKPFGGKLKPTEPGFDGFQTLKR